MKPTIVYAMFAVILFFGLITRRPLLQQLLDSAYPGVDAEGWRKLTRNWAVFFVLMAVLNEYVWRTTSPLPTDDATFWAGFKLWGAIPLTLLFAVANVPMLLRHGLSEPEAAAELPPEG
jgi:intracellular septation protein